MKILIIGAASGIAYETALTLAQRKHEIYLACHTYKEVDVVKKKMLNYKNITVIKVDILNKRDIQKVLDLDIDVLYNNVAYPQGGSILEAKMDDVRTAFEINVFSYYELLQKVLEQMIIKNSGRIIVMSSLIKDITPPFTSIYASTKCSLSIITRCLQKELKMINNSVKVVLIEPGMYHTGFNNNLLDSKYNNGYYFKNVKNKIYKNEHLLFKLGEHDNYDSIVIQIVRAIEDKHPKRVYKAPIFQSIMCKIYNFLK